MFNSKIFIYPNPQQSVNIYSIFFKTLSLSIFIYMLQNNSETVLLSGEARKHTKLTALPLTVTKLWHWREFPEFFHHINNHTFYFLSWFCSSCGWKFLDSELKWLRQTFIKLSDKQTTLPIHPDTILVSQAILKRPKTWLMTRSFSLTL